MHAHKPYGIGINGDEPTDKDRAFIAKFVAVVTNYKESSGVDSVKYTRALPDGGFVIIYDVFNALKAVVIKDSVQKPKVFNGLASTFIPMLFSGVFTKAEYLASNEGVSMTLTDMCAKRLVQYETNKKAPLKQKLFKFRCEYSPLFRELKPELANRYDSSNVMFTQYGNHRPTWYSGAMAEVIQITSGFGIQDVESLPENEISLVNMRIPPKYQERIKQELNGMRLPAYTGMPEIDGLIQCSYKFHKTNLVAFDDAHNPWLLEVGVAGAWAMPLPVIPATTTEAFREYMEEVGDHEVLSVLDKFKGIPTGEAFPLGSDFQHWYRAGVIIKLCDTSAFYEKSGYTSACGWTCDTKGYEIANTCYDYVGDHCKGYTYIITPKLVSAKDNGRLPKPERLDISGDGAAKIGRYISKLFDLLDDTTGAVQAIKYKIGRTPMKDLLLRTVNTVNDSEVRYWINLVMPPIANHSAVMSKESEGYLSSGAAFKLPEPVFKGCISMNFIPLDLKTPAPYKQLDTTVLVYFIGDEKKVVKNFIDNGKIDHHVEGNFEGSMLIGQWEQTEYLTPTGLYGDFYSTDFDFRKMLSESTRYTKIVGKDAGYGKPTMFFNIFWMDGTLKRSRYIARYTTTINKYGNYFRVAAVMPYYFRNALLFLTEDSHKQNKKAIQTDRIAVFDPNWYAVWTYNVDTHWYGAGMTAANGLNPTKGTPFPKNTNPVYAETHFVEDANKGTPSYEFADSGDWIGGLPATVTHLYNSRGEAPVIEVLGGTTVDDKPKPECTMHVSINGAARFLTDSEHYPIYYGWSPDPDTEEVVYEDGSKILFGSTQYANISYNLEGRKSFGYSKLADGKSAHNFFGVINE